VIRLYDYELSADAYKARLLLALLRIPWTPVHVDFYPGRAHHAPWFLALNPRGDLPVLDDDGTIVAGDAQAVIVHLARRYDAGRTWYPDSTHELLGQVAIWLSFADALTQTAGAARLHDGFFYDHIDVATARDGACELLAALDEQLWFGEQEGRDWLCAPPTPTVADIACFPDVMLAQEGGIALGEYRAIRRWTQRVKRIPQFIPMPGIFSIA
jgi:glutathione S-transferase